MNTIDHMRNTIMEPGVILFMAAVWSIIAAIFYTLRQSSIREKWQNLVRHIIWCSLRLRYSIDVQGLEKMEELDGQGGILFLANHPALIDPVILVSILHKNFHPRPLADQDQTNKFYLRPFMNFINAVRIPSMTGNKRKSSKKVISAIETLAVYLRKGDNILLYPAGRLYRSRHENLGAKSAAHTILRKNPGQRVVLVKTNGLWGSSFSWAEGKPTPFKHWNKMLRFLLANGLFFGPRRRVMVELTGYDFPHDKDKTALNRELEAFFNTRAQTNTAVPYYWWQGNEPIPKPEPSRKYWTTV